MINDTQTRAHYEDTHEARNDFADGIERAADMIESGGRNREGVTVFELRLEAERVRQGMAGRR